jgi:peptidoglycan/LPS O-acetylase OafA/YrhL
VATGLTWLAHTLQAVGLLGDRLEFLPRFFALFLLGAAAQVYAHRVRFPAAGVVVAALTLTLALLLFPEYRPLGAVPFAYLVLWLMVALPVRGEPAVDASYGMYVYHWPIMLILAEAGLTALGPIGYTVVTVAITGAVAVLSWYVIEAPALRRKNAAWVERRPSLTAWRAARVRSSAADVSDLPDR